MKKTEQWEKEFDNLWRRISSTLTSNMSGRKIWECGDSGEGERDYRYVDETVKSFIRSLLKQVRQESKTELTAQLEAIVAKNTDKELGTTDYDGLAEGVLAWLAKWRKREK